jgi:DNA polymerase I-like protein with 3'-5' exonuclease and polymerase domains
MKLATIKFWEEADRRGWRFGNEVTQLLHYHDEYLFSCKKEIAEDVSALAKDSITSAGEHLGFKCRMDGESKIGGSWYECH